MNRRFTTAALLTPLFISPLIGANAYATSPVEELLQARDLDGDTTTIEAYYDTRQNLTWLADTNIGESEAFGLSRTQGSPNGQEIHVSGQMQQSALEAYLSGMNQSVYLGLSNWRLPIAQTSGDTSCSIQGNGYSYGLGCSGAELPALRANLISRYGSVSRSPFTKLGNQARWLGSRILDDQHKYQLAGSGNLYTGALTTTPAYVWPVHDGDVGTPVFNAPCIDTDGDGWGWDGTASCLVSAPPVTECVDTDGDGWGWNGLESCRPVTELIELTCIDTPPVNDGWGWNGTDSCRVSITGGGSCEDHGGYPWGWNPVTRESCRLDESGNQQLIQTIEDQRAIWQAYNRGTYGFQYAVLPFGFTGVNGCPIADVLPPLTIDVTNNRVTRVTDINPNSPNTYNPDRYYTIDQIFDRMLDNVEDITETPTFAAFGGYPESYFVNSNIESCPGAGIEYLLTLCTDAFIQTDGTAGPCAQ